MLDRILRSFTLLVLAAVISCAKQEQPAATQSATATKPAAPAATGRDLASADVCKLIPGDAIAGAFGGTLVSAQPSGYGSDRSCTYSVKPAGGSFPKTYLIWLYPPDRYDSYKQMETHAEPVMGLGDDAYMTHDSGMVQIHILKKGDVTIDARGNTEEEARTVAETALTKLGS
jgi:hypothetical protein